MEIYTPNRRCPCQRCRANFIMGPAVLITIGILMLIDSYSHLNFGRTWPVLLIVIGGIKIGGMSGSTEGHRELQAAVPVTPVAAPPTQAQPGSEHTGQEAHHD